jgi:hypothetical protein
LAVVYETSCKHLAENGFLFIWGADTGCSGFYTGSEKGKSRSDTRIDAGYLKYKKAG